MESFFSKSQFYASSDENVSAVHGSDERVEREEQKLNAQMDAEQVIRLFLVLARLSAERVPGMLSALVFALPEVIGTAIY